MEQLPQSRNLSRGLYFVGALHPCIVAPFRNYKGQSLLPAGIANSPQATFAVVYGHKALRENFLGIPSLGICKSRPWPIFSRESTFRVTPLPAQCNSKNDLWKSPGWHQKYFIVMPSERRHISTRSRSWGFSCRLHRRCRNLPC